MPNVRSAKKKVRQIERRTALNKARSSRMKTFIRRFEAALGSGDSLTVQSAFREAESVIMRTAQKGVIHRNAASRKVSRLANRMKLLSQVSETTEAIPSQ